jgi:hypothetical protein
LNRNLNDLAHELLAQSLIAWRLAATIQREDDSVLLISGNGKDIRIDRAADDLPFRWMVSIDGRKRGAISLPAVLRQVRQALDPGYAANRVRIAGTPFGPSA